jgi:hypothetical protein
MARADDGRREEVIERFRDRLETFGVTHETVAPRAVARGIETAFTPSTLAAAATW